MNKNFLSITNMSSLNNFLQMIGVLGVIASLIFVGLELQQSIFQANDCKEKYVPPVLVYV